VGGWELATFSYMHMFDLTFSAVVSGVTIADVVGCVEMARRAVDVGPAAVLWHWTSQHGNVDDRRTNMDSRHQAAQHVRLRL